MYIQTDIRIGAYARILTHTRPHALQKTSSKKLVEENSGSFKYTHMYAGMYQTQTNTYTHTHANGCTHASACTQTDRRTDACAHAECMTTFIPTDRQVHGGPHARTHTRTIAYARTHIHNTYILLVCLIRFFTFWSTVFQLCRTDESSWVEPVLSKD